MNEIVYNLIEIFKWPMVVIVLGSLALCIQKKPIADLINRLRIKHRNVQTSDVPPQLSSKPGHLSTDELMDKLKRNLGADELMRSLDSPMLREAEENIKNELRARKLADSVEAIPVLVRYLAKSILAYSFEYIYGQIWGSQLSILNYLNTRPNGEASDILKSLFYEPVAKLYHDTFKTYPFETYLNFLKDSKFLIEEENRLKITPLGREFLIYLVTSGKTMDKFY